MWFLRTEEWTMLTRYLLIGALALVVGLLMGFLFSATRPVGQPGIAALQPLADAQPSRRFVVVSPDGKRVTLYEVLGGEVRRIGEARD
jgi:hypothetical protein